MAQQPQGRFLGMPYNWRRPNRSYLRKSTWDRDDDRILMPKNFGWGYTINLAEIRRRLGSGRR